MKNIIIVIITCFLAISSMSSQTTVLVKFTGRSLDNLGDSDIEMFKDGWSHVTQISSSFTNNVNIGGSSGGLTSGRVKFEKATLNMGINQLYTRLMLLAANGQHIDKMEVVYLKPSGSGPPQEFRRTTYFTVFVESVGLTGEGLADAVGIVVAYAAVERKYKKQVASGAFEDGGMMQWNQITNSAETIQ